MFLLHFNKKKRNKLDKPRCREIVSREEQNKTKQTSTNIILDQWLISAMKKLSYYLLSLNRSENMWKICLILFLIRHPPVKNNIRIPPLNQRCCVKKLLKVQEEQLKFGLSNKFELKILQICSPLLTKSKNNYTLRHKNMKNKNLFPTFPLLYKNWEVLSTFEEFSQNLQGKVSQARKNRKFHPRFCNYNVSIFVPPKKKNFFKNQNFWCKAENISKFQKISQPKKTYLKKLFSGSGCEKLTKLIKTTAFIGLIFMNDD